MSFATGIREATDEEVDALVGPGFSEWWRANAPKPKTIRVGRRRLPEDTVGECWKPYTVQEIRIAAEQGFVLGAVSPELDEAVELVKASRRLVPIIAATQKLPAPGHTTVAGLGASAGTKQGIIDAVMAVDNVLWCGIVEDNAAGKIHILVRQDEVDQASRSEIIDAIMQTKPAGIRAVGPIRMNGAAFQFVTKAELFSGKPIQLYDDLAAMGKDRPIFSVPASGRTSTAQHCAKCGTQSKHAESETSMGLCFDCFEARR